MASIFKFSAKACDYQGDPASKEAKAFLGGKGAGLVMMAQQGLNVPPGFTITTKVCNEYRALDADAKEAYLDELMGEVAGGMVWLMDHFGYTPLVSVRSGAAVSMPGMMDTILNVGLTEDNELNWTARIGERATSDSFRRLIQMLGATAYGVPMSVFDFQLAKAKKKFGAIADTDLTADMLDVVCASYVKAFEQNKGFAFPTNDVVAQTRAAIKAVFNSWDNPRAVEYRKINKLSDDMGTAVTVQAMVFGNMGEDSGSGVLFTRDPSTGERKIMGEYLVNAQGEDVVSGVRTPEKLDKYLWQAEENSADYKSHDFWAADLAEACWKLETLYSDMVDVEFTVQKGELFILQSRTGKRSARAAFKIAVDLVGEGVISRADAFKRLSVDQLKTVRRPSIDPKFKVKPNVVGLAACPGVVTGRAVFSAQDAVDCKEPCILVTHETNPNDIAGMAKAVGVLTQTGGATSHAAVVARSLDKACVVGCAALDLDALKAKAGHGLVTIDGSTGNVWFGVDVPVLAASDAPEISQIVEWCLDELNAIEATAAALVTPREHRIFAAKWWGNATVLDFVLADLVALPSRQHVSLDIRAPSEFEAPVDAVLNDCFGVKEHDGFQAVIMNAMGARQSELAGLIVFSGHNPDYKRAVPGDYAAFTVLAH